MHADCGSYLAPAQAFIRRHTGTHKYWVTNNTIN